MNKKLLSIMLVIIVSITLIGVTALVVVMKFLGNEDEQKEPSIKEVVEASVDIPEITTNLTSGNIVRLSFKIETDSKKAKEELEQREFQIRDIIISELANMTAEQLDGKEGMDKLKETVKMKSNELMQEGKINKVYTTSYILQ
ncbi:flagellar basal body-associated protein FliL [Metabacillus sediminilitoris]|uniref:Flagellar protein FliL n=1 Tax=Metabacillus sediminilitoris TaxID=2567941 RepID=A0A4S4C5A6_9BACI|nr:flagellar basal body-associated protein FliL [Metabacillus sediminilitoris]QGQ46849.1 flagellar basal body-associated protein FliL [Metabacillus sediminilitoris]THF82997.1 flagellar basal body-associated protein FliL [Metabacillus sediminilitoris]